MRKLGFLITLLILLYSNNIFGQVSQYKVQSLFMYNFTKHIKWPNTSGSFTIGILGRSDIQSELLTAMKGKQVDGKEVEIKIISSIEEALSCQMVYVPTNKSKELPALLTAISSKDVLVVTENDLSEKGAGISFITVEDKLRFKINQEVLSKGGLQVSGGLLSLALK